MSSLVVSKVPDPSDISHSILPVSSGGWGYCPHFADGYPEGTAKLKVTQLQNSKTWSPVQDAQILALPVAAPGHALGGLLLCPTA